MLTKYDVASVLLLSILVLFANPVQIYAQAEKDFVCPQPPPSFFDTMCDEVGEPDFYDTELVRVMEPLEEAACIYKSKDSSSVIESKLNLFWKNYSKQMVCSRTDFRVAKGYIT